MRHGLLVCLLLLLVLPAAGPAQTVSRTVSVPLASSTNLDESNGALRITSHFVPEAGQPVIMEAERANVLRFTAAKGQLLPDATASGGLCVAFVDHMEYHFVLAEAGRYTAWYRASFPLRGNWNHTENMDGGPTRTLTDSQGEVLDQWLWVKGPTYDLAAGEHSWNFTPYGWMGGTKLDKVLLVRDPVFKPEGLGPAREHTLVPIGGEAVTEQLRPRTLVRWQKVQFDNISGAGIVNLEASTDSAVSWQPVPDSGDLSALPPGKPLALRLRLTATGQGVSPYIKNLRVTYEAKTLPPVILENDQLRLTFAGDSGTLTGLLNKRTQTECLTPGVETPLFSFVGYRPEFHTVVEIGFGQAQLTKVTPGKDQVTLSFSLLDGTLRPAVRVKLDGPVARFAMSVSNQSPYEIAQVRLLSPKGLRIGADCTDDYLFTPITTGSIVKYPAALEYPRQIYTDRPLAYPGMATMCWMDLWDERGGGVYLACEDPRYRLTELTFSNGSEDLPKEQAVGIPPPGNPAYKYAKVPGQYVNLGFDKRLRIPRETVATVPEVVLGVHEGDWHWGADQYRAWAEPWQTKLKQTPDWFLDDLGINNVHAIHLGSFVDLPKGRPRGGRQGTMQDTLFPLVALWCQHASCESAWSTPVLHTLLGTEEEFIAGVQKQHEMGHRFISYNLPRALNPLFNQGEKRIGIVPISSYPRNLVPPVGFYAEVGERLYDGALVSPDGQYSEANTCWGATKWRAHERHVIVDKYLRQYRNDGMYMDGTGLDDIRTQDCKSLSHGHDTYGEWSRDLIGWLAQVKAEADQTRPGTIFMGEGMGDVYHTVLDTGLFYPENAPEVYRYTCPWNIGTIMPGTSPIPNWPDGGLEYGAVYGLKIAGLDMNFEKDPERFRQYLIFRESFHQLQSRARFADSVGLSVSDGKVISRLYRRQDAGNRYALVCSYNSSATRTAIAHLQASLLPNARAAWYCDLDRDWLPLQLERQSGNHGFTLPWEPLSACLLVDKCEPLICIAEPKPIVPGESGKIMVSVTNLEAGTVRGRLSLQLPVRPRSQNSLHQVAQSTSSRKVPPIAVTGLMRAVHPAPLSGATSPRGLGSTDSSFALHSSVPAVVGKCAATKPQGVGEY